VVDSPGLVEGPVGLVGGFIPPPNPPLVGVDGIPPGVVPVVGVLGVPDGPLAGAPGGVEEPGVEEVPEPVGGVGELSPNGPWFGMIVPLPGEGCCGGLLVPGLVVVPL